MNTIVINKGNNGRFWVHLRPYSRDFATTEEAETYAHELLVKLGGKDKARIVWGADAE